MKIFYPDRPESFAKKDKQILQTEHQMVDTIRDCDLIYLWFGNLQALKILIKNQLYRKPLVVVAGGYECTHVLEIDYGWQGKWETQMISKTVFERANLVLAVSDFNRGEVESFCTPRRLETVYHGFDSDRWHPKTQGKDRKMVLTVGGVKLANWRRKGLLYFIETARIMPSYTFVLAGRINPVMNKYTTNLPPNLELTGYVSDQKLLELYQQSHIYVQASWHEAFGCSLAEAMLCESIPVISNHEALPDVVGDCGTCIVDHTKPHDIQAAIEVAAAYGKGPRSRQHIIDQYPIEKRRKQLLDLVGGIA